MKRLLWVLGVLCLIVLVIFVVVKYPGYFLIQLKSTSITMPIWLAFLGFIVLVIMGVVAWRVLSWLLCLPSRLKARREKARQAKQQKWLREGINQWILEDWRAVEKTFKKLSSHGFMPKQSLLLAAKIANFQQRAKTENEYLAAAEESKDKSYPWMVNLVRADTAISAQQWSEARRLLDALALQQPQNPFIARRQLKVYLNQEEWALALQAMHSVRKEQMLSAEKEQKYLLRIYQGLLKAASQQSVEALQTVWSHIPDALQRHKELITLYAQLLLKLRQDSALEAFLRKALKQRFDETWFILYCQCYGKDPVKQMEDADEWFREAPQTAKTLLAMGYLCANQQLLGRAKFYFQSSLQVHPSKAAYQALGGIFAKEQQYAEAVQAFQNAFKYDS